MDASLLLRYLRIFHSRCLSVADFAKLLAHYGSVSAIANSQEHGGVISAALSIDNEVEAAVSRDLAWHDQPAHQLLVYEAGDYPPLLREIPSPPPILYVAGDPACLQQPALAVVGSRKCSAYGRQQAQWLAHDLARAGLTICSGMARGIDTAAHQGALAASRPTIAVLGTGPDVVYPPGNKKLARQIIEQGALVSEFALGTPALPANFPRRNRIICGLAIGTLVVEATLRSGSLITARQALEQNRDVFAVPGLISQARAQGCHELIKSGAKLVECANDVLQELPGEWQLIADAAGDSRAGEKARAIPPSLRAQCRQIVTAMAGDDCLYETLLQRTSLNASELTGALLELEMAGMIKAEGGRYVPMYQSSLPSKSG